MMVLISSWKGSLKLPNPLVKRLLPLSRNWPKRCVFCVSYPRTWFQLFRDAPNQIEVNIAVLWEGARDDPKQVRARKEVLDIVATILDQVRIWTDAEKLHRDSQVKSERSEEQDIEMA